MAILQTAEELVGKHVFDIKGFKIGEIKDFEINPDTWQITRLVIALSDKAVRELGLRKRILTPRVCIPILAITSSIGNISLNKSLKEFYEKDPEIIKCSREAFF